MTTKLLDMSKNTFQDLLDFGYSNLSKSLAAFQSYEEHVNAINNKELCLLHSFTRAESTLEQGNFLNDNDISSLMNHLLEYKETRDAFEIFRKDGSDYNLTNITGVETHLKGVFYDQILELNKYIYTTSSTNRPEDPTFQEMFLGFYAPKSVVMRLAEFLSNKGKFNYYACYENNDNKIIIENKENTKNFKDDFMRGGTTIYTEFPQELINMGIFNHLFGSEDPVVYMFIEDPIITHRDLYSVILSFFKH